MNTLLDSNSESRTVNSIYLEIVSTDMQDSGRESVITSHSGASCRAVAICL